ncbi:MAG TPA: zf-HC2 domain-containing protein, partial [Thermoguttaceae bacterium]|nr:zf-HC2 domain-containing protein [Thermoguttaceae bacterium]
MKNLPENELFSAYLDGELTAEEQAQVERMLAESPAARQLLDQLRALSSTLQGLPQYKLDGDLSETVLRNAERAILTRPVPSTSAQPTS